ncbi:uncharacterized protein LOC110999472 [Pieris rapae]|uniref:uncharacterized protein LOC110999472 n=1 Tax=Pieris rapae TaxID=64459 RepID=UPI001E27FE6E|nr:uncharacterized protein LOC110999472 [Pieris rapae]
MTVGPETEDSLFGFGMPSLEALGIKKLESENHTAHLHRPDTPPDSPEPDEVQPDENVARMDEMQRGNENIAHADVIAEFFRKYPQANNSFANIMDLYSDRHLEELLRRIDEENLHEGDPMKRFILLYNFYKAREDFENDKDILMKACLARIDAGEPILF